MKVALIMSVVLQFSAAIIALTLVRRTRTNIAWWLISTGFLLMAFRRVFEVLMVFDPDNQLFTGLLSSWTGILISLTMLLSLIFIRRIFNIQKRIDDLHKQNEARVLSAVLKTEERERQNFAKELHDGLGPLLSSIKMMVSTMEQTQLYNSKIVTNTNNLIDESITTLKEISNRLSPHILSDFGLFKALKSFINKLQISNELKINFDSNLKDKRFPFKIEMVLYRVVCELISNTLKHAHAKNIDIKLFADKDTISLNYSDDGIGFVDEQVIEDISGFGFSNIKSRIKSLNGSFESYTKPGEGVKVSSIIKII